MVCIVNWDARHNVTSGNNASPSGVWNPETLDGLSETEKTGLIAYGVVYLEEDKSADQLLSIPLTYYDKNAPAPNGKYTIIISCSTSRYGDYMIENMVELIAEKNLTLVEKLEVVSRTTIREKLLTYLARQAEAAGARTFTIPMGRTALAEYLCTDRSAMTRELARMRDEGLIDYTKRTFTLRQ